MLRFLAIGLVLAFTQGCGGDKSGTGTSTDSWTAGAADLSGLGVTFTAPTGMEARSGTGTSLNWTSASGDEGVVLRYEVGLSASSLANALGDSESLSDRSSLTAADAASSISIASGKGLKRRYSGLVDSGKTVTAWVAAIPRDSFDQTGFGGVKVVVWGTGGDSEILRARFNASVDTLRFTLFSPSLPARQFLAVGEWSFAGKVSSDSASASVGRQLVWLCTGRMAYKQTGFTGSSVLEAADGTLITGTWEAYSGAGQPLLYLRIDGQADPKLIPITVQTEGRAFTWSGKQFLGTDRGCELGLPTQLRPSYIVANW